MYILSIILIVFLVAGWTAAWLRWMFKGELRHALFAFVFPKSWRAGRSATDIATLSSGDFEMFLSAESEAPAFVRGVLGCPDCLSAHIAATGIALGLAGHYCHSLFLFPLVWATAAWIGGRLYHRF